VREINPKRIHDILTMSGDPYAYPAYIPHDIPVNPNFPNQFPLWQQAWASMSWTTAGYVAGVSERPVAGGVGVDVGMGVGGDQLGADVRGGSGWLVVGRGPSRMSTPTLRLR